MSMQPSSSSFPIPLASSKTTWWLGGLLIALLVVVHLGHRFDPWSSLMVWFALALLSEQLWCLARDGEHRHRAAPFVHVATVVMLSGPLALGVNVAGALAGSKVFTGAWRVRYPLFVFFSSGLALIAMAVFNALAGAKPSMYEQVLSWLLTGAVYHAIYQACLTQCSYKARGLGWTEAWKENYGHATEYVAVTAMILVSLMAILASRTLGVGGACLAVIPAYFVFDGWRRYLELEQTQRRIIDAERLSAKGEMAGEIGHELNNYLAAISGRAQLIAMDESIPGDMVEEVEGVNRAAMGMADLARGLMDMSQREAKVERFWVTPVLHQALEIVKPQARFAQAALEIDLQARVQITLDPGLFQQMILTLLKRAVTLGPEGESPALYLATTLEDSDSTLQVEVIRNRKNPSFEKTHPEPLKLRGGDRELAGVRRMVERHRGSFVAHADSEGRQAYRIQFPAALDS